MIKLLSLFSGMGAFEAALRQLNIPFNIVNFCEIEPKAIEAYCKLNNINATKNLGDITKAVLDDQPVDLITYGFPCQPFSIAGLQQGFDDQLGRGLMFFESLRVIKHYLPPCCIAENVKNLTNFTKEFNLMLNELTKLGYTNQVLTVNSKDYGSPQNRERIFIISTREPIPPIVLHKSNITLSDCILPYDMVDEKEYLQSSYYNNKFDYSNISFAILEDFYANRPIRVYESYSPALRASRSGLKVVQDGRLRKLTVREGFALMGFTDTDYNLLANIAKTHLWKMLGNSIDVKIIYQIFSQLFVKNKIIPNILED